MMIMKLTKTIYKNDYFSIEIQKNWKTEISDSTFIFYNPKGFGAIQISIYILNKSEKMNIVKQLNKFIFNKNIKQKPIIDIISKTDNKIAKTNLVYNGRYWKFMIVKSNKYIAILTYNCNNNDKEEELEIIDDSFSSFKLE